MLVLFDVHDNDPKSITPFLASVDVSDNTESERAAILAALKQLYGTSATYYQHNCGHDTGASCSQVVV